MRRWDHATLAERCARESGDPLVLYLALCWKAGSACMPPQAAGALIGEISSVESPKWPPRVRCMRWRALW